MFSRMSERQQQLAVAAACVLLYLPLAGCYGMWDPWETHYGEIARQILVRHDWVSLWWPCSPQDRPEVFHKPVLHFWLMALSMKAFGLETARALPSEAVDGWRIEWACRLPNIFLSIAAIVAVWTFVRRVVGTRTAWMTAAILGTSSQWVLVTRQAMTDMPFVVPMTIALCHAGLAIFEEEKQAKRKWPFVVLFLLIVIPQLVVTRKWIYLLACAGAWPPRTTRQMNWVYAWLWCGVAMLAKGPAGVLMPGLVLVIYLLISGRAREILRMEWARGALIFVAVSFPWYHAMLVRHKMAFWREFIGDNYIHRAQGRHGDRGTFDYYLQWMLYAMFPWSGLAVVGMFVRKHAVAMFALVWIAVELAILTVVNTKFHHYVLPILPPLAILAALAIGEASGASRGASEAAVPPRMPGSIDEVRWRWLVAVPVTFLVGWDLARQPAKLLFLFSYDYVVVPGTGRAWPAGFEYGAIIFGFAIVATLMPPRWMVGVAIAWSLFLADKMLIELSPHWSQKGVIEAYYRQRRDEPLVVWQLYWRGENFYTRNQIWSREKTVVLDDGKKFLQENRGRRMYFLVERAKYGSLKSAVPNLEIVDQSNNKLYLAVGAI